MKIKNIYRHISAFSFAILLSLSACNKEVSTTEDSHNHEQEEHTESEDVIVFSAEQEKILGVEKIKIESDTFYQTIKTSGKILPAQGDEKTIVATTNGIVNFAKKGVSEGATIKNGEAIFSVNSQKIGEGDVVAKTRNLYEAARKEYERANNLLEYKLISEKEYNEIRLSYENAKLSYNALSTSSNGGVNVSAPISGFVKTILVSDGQYVNVGEPLAVVTQSNKLQLRAEVSQKFYSSLPNITSANIVLPFDNSVIKLSELNGEVISYGKSMEDNDFYIPINFSFNNIGNIISGSFVEVYLLGLPKSNTIVIPKTALLDVQGDYFVIANIHDDEYQQKRVTIGNSDGQNVEILGGLSEGEVIVSKGAYLVKQAKAGAEIPHGHTH